MAQIYRNQHTIDTVGGELVDELRIYYDHQAAQARQHEDQRERMTNIILTVASVLVGLVTFSKLALWSLPAAIMVPILGIFGFFFAGKHYERNRLHASIMFAIRAEMDRIAEEGGKPRKISEVKADGEEYHYKHFSWPQFRGPRKESQAAAKSWIARQRLHPFWEVVHILIVIIGIFLVVTLILI